MDILPMAKEFQSQVSKSLTSYFRLWDFLALRVEALNGGAHHTVASEAEFWSRIYANFHGHERDMQLSLARSSSAHAPSVLRHGDQVSLQSWYLSDWVPRMPGELWRQTRELDGLDFQDRVPSKIRDSLRAYSHLHPSGVVMAAGLPVYDWFGKTRMCLSGIGSIRFPMCLRDTDHYACLSAVTANSWQVDLGIPIVISNQVYREFNRARLNSNTAVEADVRGSLVLGHLPEFFDNIPIAIGSSALPSGLDKALSKSAGLPAAYIHVTSPLDCDFRVNDSHPDCNAWSLFRCSADSSVNDEHPDLARMLRGVGSFGLTYCPFQPADEQSLDRALLFLQDSPRWLQLMKEQTWDGWLGHGDTPDQNLFMELADTWSEMQVALVTDFDGMVPRLQRATFSLHSNPFVQAEFKPFRDQYLRDQKEFAESVYSLAKEIGCPKCGRELASKRALQCLCCGLKWFKCPACSNEWKRGEKICDTCGYSLYSNNEA